jgi:ribosome-associated protein YbcJ (S4-like RNA binding protein)
MSYEIKVTSNGMLEAKRGEKLLVV